MATVDELLIRIDATTEGLRRELKKAETAVTGAAGKMQRDTANMDRSLNRLQGSLTGLTRVLGAFGIALGVGALIGFTKRSLEAAGGLGELAQQLGVSTQSLQVYQYAATQAGLKSEELNTGLARLSRTIGDAAQGEKAASDAFRRMGVAVTDAQGNLRSTDAVLRDVADRFAAMPNDAREAALAVDLFGKSGQKLLPVLNEGSAGLDRFAERARALGIVLSEEQIAAADKAADQWAEFEMIMGRVAQSVAVDLAPALSEIFATLSRPEVIDGITTAFKALGFVIQYAVQALAGFLELLAGATPLLDEVTKIAEGRANERMGGIPAMMAEIAKQAQLAIPSVQDLMDELGGGGGSGEVDKAVENFRKIAESIHDATLDLEFEATLVGKTARETDYLRKRRELLNAALETGIEFSKETLPLIEEMAGRYADAAESVRDLEAAQEASKKAAEEAADAAAKAAEDFQRQVEQVAGSIADDLTEALFEGGKNGFEDILDNVGEWVRRIGLEILKQQIILPITTQLVGGLSGLFGISGSGAGGNGFDLVGAVGGLATDAFDWVGRMLGFGPSVQTGAGGRLTGGGVTAGFSPGGGFDLGGALGELLGGGAVGYGIGSLVQGFNLFGKTGPGASIGGGIGGALGSLAGSFIPIPGLDIVGGLLGSLVGSLFGPSPSSGPFSYGTAHSQGGRLAYVGSKSLKGGVGDMAPLVNETTAVANQLADLFGAEFADNALLRIGYIANEQGVKGYSVSGAGKGNQAFNNYKFFGENKQAAQLFAIEQAIMGGGFNGLSVGGGLQGLSEQEKALLGKSFDIRKSTEEVLKDARLIVDLFGEIEEVTSEAARALRDINQAYDEQVERARELGIAEELLETRRAEAIAQLKSGFVEGIEDQILAITDPLAFAIKQLDKEFETIRANAEDFGVGMVEVERLYGLRRQQIMEQIAQATVSDLQRFLEELQFGELSGGSPSDRLSGARAAFEAAAAQALAGDASARGRIQDLGSTLLASSRDYNASGAGYFADLQRVTEIVEALLGDVPGYAAGTAFHRGGAAIVGEQGPELMFMPRGAAVAPNGFLGLLSGLRGAGNDNGREGLKVQIQQLGVLRTLADRLGALESLAASQGSLIRRLQSLIPADKAA